MSSDAAKVKSIFLNAVEHCAPHDWPGFLDRECAENPELRIQVEWLLSGHRNDVDLIEQAGAAFNHALPSLEHLALQEQPGTVIGPYKLLEQIGEGGFGVVFLAEQERPVRRRVALKIIKPGMDTRQVIARFEAERQALAMMDHPNIAKVFDAGTTGVGQAFQPDVNLNGPTSQAGKPDLHSGRPYFVMELVQGVPITEYCDQCNLTTRERLELFISVCQAVQHAHQKGVIHRDIKPTNVLVTMQDGRPIPKIIDFGVAKAIHQRLTEHTLTIAFAQMVGTPLYMSPEQAELSPLGVDTRSDIYSLGVVLYELLTGATPFDKDRLHAASYDELRRIIREEEPPRPSARISTLAADVATTVVEHRCTDTRRLRQTVRGDVDWIVMKCLEKDRNRRYDSAGSLARDIERYLHDEPVQACPPSIPYRLKKFIRRNKAAAAFICLLLTGVAALTVSNIQSRRNERRAVTESARAKAVSDLLQEMLGSADVGRAKGSQYMVREMLDDYSAGLGSQLADQPVAEADIHATIARAYRSLLLPERAQPHFEKAIERRRLVDGPHHENEAALLVDYAWNLHGQQKYSEAEAQLLQALEIYRRRGITGGPAFHALEILQHVLISSNRDDDAERVTEEALAISRHSDEEFPDQANLLHRYAGMRNRQGRFAEAEQLARQSVDMHRRLHGDQHPETAWALKMLATALLAQQELAEAESAIRDCVAIFRRSYPEDHFTVRDANNDLRKVLEARADTSALEALAKEEAQIEIRSNSPDYHVRLAGLLLANNQPSDAQKDEARRLIQQAIERYRRVAIDSPSDFRLRMNAADGCALAIQICAAAPGFANEVDEMSRWLKAELPQLLAAFPNSSQCQWEVAMGYLSLGRVVYPYSEYLATSEHAFRESVEVLKKYSLSDPERRHLWTWLASAYSFLGDVQWRSGRLPDAEAPLQSAMKIYDEHAADIVADPIPGVSFEVNSGYIHYALYLAVTGREQQAAEFVRKAVLDVNRVTDPGNLVQALSYRALAQVRLGDDAGYRATCNALVDVPITSADGIDATVWTWSLAPGALDDMSLLVKRAEEYVAKNSLHPPHVRHHTLGKALYRAGQYDRAADELQASIAAYPPSEPPIQFRTIPSARLLLAMTRWRQGQHDQARRLLSDAAAEVDKELENQSLFIERRVRLEVLHREALALIGAKEADEGLTNDNVTPTSTDNGQLTTDN